MDRLKFANDITPDNDDNNILNNKVVPEACQSRIINCAVGGTISFIDGNGDTATFTAIAGINYPVSTRRILATGTTATGIIALW